MSRFRRLGSIGRHFRGRVNGVFGFDLGQVVRVLHQLLHVEGAGMPLGFQLVSQAVALLRLPSQLWPVLFISVALCQQCVPRVGSIRLLQQTEHDVGEVPLCSPLLFEVQCNVLASLFPCGQKSSTEATTPRILVVHDDLVLFDTGRRFPAGRLAALPWLFAMLAALLVVSKES